MKTANFISPNLLGSFLDPKTGSTQGVYCYGLAIDEAGVVVACILGGHITRLSGFEIDVGFGQPLAIDIESERVEFSFGALAEYETYHYQHQDGLGALTLMLHKASLMGVPLMNLGGEPHFYVWGPQDGEAPHLDLWARRMQDILSLPLDDAWHPLLWQQMLEQEWAVPCQNLGGFAPLWDVTITAQDWQDFVMDLVSDGTLN